MKTYRRTLSYTRPSRCLSFSYWFHDVWCFGIGFHCYESGTRFLGVEFVKFEKEAR